MIIFFTLFVIETKVIKQFPVIGIAELSEFECFSHPVLEWLRFIVYCSWKMKFFTLGIIDLY